MLRPAVRLCRRFRIPLKPFLQLCRLAYFEELRDDERTHVEVARIFDMSLRTVGSLEAEYKAGEFLAPEDEITLSRHVETALGDGSFTTAEIAAALDQDEERIQLVLEGLAGAGRVFTDDGRWRMNHAYVSLVKTDLRSRLDGLRHQLEVVAATVHTRFLSDRRPAMARTFSIEGRADVMERLAQELVKEVRGQCGDAEDASLTGGSTEGFAITIALGPSTEAGDSA